MREMDDFMKDRYGADELTTVMGVAGMVLAFAGTVARLQWLSYIGLAVVVLALVRAFSKNQAARQRENDAWLALKAKLPFVGAAGGQGSGRAAAGGNGTARASATMDDVKRQARTAKKMWKDRKTKAFLKCPTCGTTLAVPKGKGKLIVTCPKCHSKMETRS